MLCVVARPCKACSAARRSPSPRHSSWPSVPGRGCSAVSPPNTCSIMLTLAAASVSSIVSWPSSTGSKSSEGAVGGCAFTVIIRRHCHVVLLSPVLVVPRGGGGVLYDGRRAGGDEVRLATRDMDRFGAGAGVVMTIQRAAHRRHTAVRPSSNDMAGAEEVKKETRTRRGFCGGGSDSWLIAVRLQRRRRRRQRYTYHLEHVCLSSASSGAYTRRRRIQSDGSHD